MIFPSFAQKYNLKSRSSNATDTIPFNGLKHRSKIEVWQISRKSHICFIHGNLITVREGCILRYLLDTNQWEIVTNTITKFRIYNESRSQFYTSIDKIKGIDLLDL